MSQNDLVLSHSALVARVFVRLLVDRDALVVLRKQIFKTLSSLPPPFRVKSVQALAMAMVGPSGKEREEDDTRNVDGMETISNTTTSVLRQPASPLEVIILCLEAHRHFGGRSRGDRNIAWDALTLVQEDVLQFLLEKLEGTLEERGDMEDGDRDEEEDFPRNSERVLKILRSIADMMDVVTKEADADIAHHDPISRRRIMDAAHRYISLLSTVFHRPFPLECFVSAANCLRQWLQIKEDNDLVPIAARLISLSSDVASSSRLSAPLALDFALLSFPENAWDRIAMNDRRQILDSIYDRLRWASGETYVEEDAITLLLSRCFLLWIQAVPSCLPERVFQATQTRANSSDSDSDFYTNGCGNELDLNWTTMSEKTVFLVRFVTSRWNLNGPDVDAVLRNIFDAAMKMEDPSITGHPQDRTKGQNQVILRQ